MRFRPDRPDESGLPSFQGRALGRLSRPISAPWLALLATIAMFALLLLMLLSSGSFHGSLAPLSALASCLAIFLSQVAVWAAWDRLAPGGGTDGPATGGVRVPRRLPPLWDRDLDG